MSEQASKQQILKSTGILGSAQILIIGIGMVRVKVLAVLLGPLGVGIAGSYQQIIELVKACTGFGLTYSAVRDIAASAATGDEKQIATTILVLRRWVWATGLLGMVLCILFSKQLSIWSFDNVSHTKEIIILSGTILLAAISSGQSSLLQGLRQIGNMAKANVLAALTGLAAACVVYYFWGIAGIVPAILLTSITALIVTWHYSKKIKVIPVRASPSVTIQKGKSMIKLGFFLSLAGLAGTGTMYLVRAFVVQQGGLVSVGHFIAAWSVSSMYISAIFGAMGADYFPRLSAIHNDDVAMTTMVNEQSEIAVLLTAPIIIGMISFIDLVVYIFYSKEFSPSAGILSWQLAGDFFKVLSWPLGFIMLAKAKSKLFIITELAWHAMYLAFVYFGWLYFQIEITGIAFLAAYIVYTCILSLITMKMINFQWSYKLKKYICFLAPCVLLSFLSSRFLFDFYRYSAGIVLTFSAVCFSFYHIKDIFNFGTLLARLKFLRAKQQ